MRMDGNTIGIAVFFAAEVVTSSGQPRKPITPQIHHAVLLTGWSHTLQIWSTDEKVIVNLPVKIHSALVALVVQIFNSSLLEQHWSCQCTRMSDPSGKTDINLKNMQKHKENTSI